MDHVTTEIGMVRKIKDYFGGVSAIATGLGVIIGGWLLIDERYAHAQVVKQIQFDQARQIQQFRVESTKKFYQARVDDLDQKKFELEIKEKKTQQDQIFIKRYENKISELKTQSDSEVKNIESDK